MGESFFSLEIGHAKIEFLDMGDDYDSRSRLKHLLRKANNDPLPCNIYERVC